MEKERKVLLYQKIFYCEKKSVLFCIVPERILWNSTNKLYSQLLSWIRELEKSNLDTYYVVPQFSSRDEYQDPEQKEKKKEIYHRGIISH